jgi:hypothetical protein
MRTDFPQLRLRLYELQQEIYADNLYMSNRRNEADQLAYDRASRSQDRRVAEAAEIDWVIRYFDRIDQDRRWSVRNQIVFWVLALAVISMGATIVWLTLT